MDIAATLAAELGAHLIHADAATIAAHAVHGALPLCVVAPETIEQLQTAVRLCRDARAMIVPWGGGTQQLIGGPLTRQPFVAIATPELRRVLIHEPDDLTISVEAGIALSSLTTHLGRFGQSLPIDAPLPERATIGGLIATATDGPRRLGYGTLRDLLIGIAVVELDGTISRGGGMVVKNVSGFDMMKLYLGSLGSLAIIVSANFKLLPAPRRAATVLARFVSRDAAFAAIDGLASTQLTPSAAEYLSPAASAAIGLGDSHALALRAEGLAAAVERHLMDLTALCIDQSGAMERLEDDAALWRQIGDLPQTADLADDEAVVKLSTLPGDLNGLLAQIETLAPGAPVLARALSGVAYLRLASTTAHQIAAIVATGAAQWVATPLADAPRWGTLGGGTEVMRRIKREFDPNGLLNPGRCVVDEVTG